MNLPNATLILPFLWMSILGPPALQAQAPSAAPPLAPFLAIPDLVGWPNLILQPDGTILATLFNHPSHATAEGDMDLWASGDGGASWEFRGRPGPRDANTLRNHQAVGHARNGDLIVLTTGWTNEYAPGKSGPPFRAGLLPPWVSRSSDGGRTWQVDRRPDAFAASPTPGGRVVFGNIMAGADGDLRAATYTSRYTEGMGTEQDRALIYRSADDGRTWIAPVVIDPAHALNETSITYLGDGHWLAAARRGGTGGLQVYRSTDDAATWKDLGQVTAANQHPAHLLVLKDGRILLAYGNRSSSPCHVEVMLSADRGDTWSAPARLASWSGDGGYPASVQREDGKLFTAFYGRATDYHEGYHVGGVIWELDQVFPAAP